MNRFFRSLGGVYQLGVWGIGSYNSLTPWGGRKLECIGWALGPFFVSEKKFRNRQPSGHLLRSYNVRLAPANVQAIVEPVVSSLGYELVGVEFLMQGRSGLLRVYIDTEEGIRVEDCQRVSHQLSGVLDVEDVIKGQYQLEVSSPGLDRPLFTMEHFERFVGHRAKLKLVAPKEGQRKFRGTLRGVKDDQIILEVENEEISLPLSSIDKANLIPEI